MFKYEYMNKPRKMEKKFVVGIETNLYHGKHRAIVSSIPEKKMQYHRNPSFNYIII